MARKSNAPSLFDLDDAPVAVAEDPSVVARREQYRARLAEKLKDPEFRKIEGFPIGTDEAILALSDPPYYTACPNPFLDEWLAENAKPYDAATDSYHREPFAADVSEGKNDPIYNAHSYHTKVPHKAIMRYILHYTQPGDIVFDGFCGTGMTGVAALLCGDRTQVESLGYTIDRSGGIWEAEAWAARRALDNGQRNPHPHLLDPQPLSRLGTRKAILNDLSPAATYITHNYNSPIEASAFDREADRVLAAVEAECGWMYTTLHASTATESAKWAERITACHSIEDAKAVLAEISPSRRGRINYTVWSDVFLCPACGADIVFWDAAVDESIGGLRDVFACPSCNADTNKRVSQRKRRTDYDAVLGRGVERAVQVPVLVSYSIGSHRTEKRADKMDAAMAALAGRLALRHPIPVAALPAGFNTQQPMTSHGISHVHQFHWERGLHAFSLAWRIASLSGIRCAIMGGYRVGLRMSNFLVPQYFNKSTGPMKPLTSGMLYVPSICGEQNWLNVLKSRFEAVGRQVAAMPRIDQNARPVITTGSTSGHVVKAEAVDYIFTDPPFGGNLMYSELNSLNEGWLGVRTESGTEAIECAAVGKSLADYQVKMIQAFREYYSALKPGRWMTVEFHNSSNAVWNSIQKSLEIAGFVIADVRVLDKKQPTFKNVTMASATKQDLVISCYKPTSSFQDRFSAHMGQAEGVRDFLEQHLEMVPVASVTKTGELERLAERTISILYDRMIAYHLVRGAPVPMPASEFTKVLHEHFVQRDDMWFVAGQEVRYDLCKLRGVDVEQQVLFVSDERSAVSWLRSELNTKPQTLGGLTPKFMQAAKEWPKHEPRPELRELLRDWFIEVDGRWANPNPDDEKHVEALRKKSLLRLFATYAAGKGKLKEFRREALIEAFRYCWNSGQEAVFVTVCQRIPDKLLRDDAQLSEAYDLAADRIATRPTQPELDFEWE